MLLSSKLVTRVAVRILDRHFFHVNVFVWNLKASTKVPRKQRSVGVKVKHRTVPTVRQLLVYRGNVENYSFFLEINDIGAIFCE